MNFTIPIYQRKHEQRLRWTTIGLREHNETQTGKSPFKMQRHLIELLKRKISELPPQRAAQMGLVRGMELVRARLDLSLKGERKRKHSGLFPLILCPFWASQQKRLTIVFHPEDQERWFPMREDRALAEQASAFFSRAWASLEHEQLKALESNRKDILRAVSFSAQPKSLLDLLPDQPRGLWDDLEPEQLRQPKKRRTGLRVLPELGSDQTQRAAEDSLHLGMPRELYRKQLGQLLCGKEKRSVLVVGPPGCGKSTLLSRWARDLLEADDYPTHQNLDRVHHVWLLSGKRIIAGMSYLGDWEERCTQILEDVRGKKIILQLEDVHDFGHIGQSRSSDRSLASFFSAPLARGEVVMVGECTPAQLQRLSDSAPSFVSRFAKIFVQPTLPEETMRIMFHEARELELRNDVIFSPHTLRAVIELGGALFSGSAFPGKALDLLRELARSDRPQNPGAQEAQEGEVKIEPSDLIALLSARTGLPELLLHPEARLSPQALQKELEAQIMGQPEAISAAADLILRIREGLTDKDRPYGVYLLTGPTGVGKTELAKCIAEYLYGDPRKLIRLDMSEFSAWDAPGRLIGDRFSPEGLLTRPVQEQPFSVVLLDEIEKADPAVLNLLLQLFDEGRLTDASGTLTDFTHTVIIMTSNLGSRERATVGFGVGEAERMRAIEDAVRAFFPPELFNRIDRVVRFSHLSQAVALQIAEKELSRLVACRGLTERSIFVYAQRSVLERAVLDGFSEALGARPIKRYLEEQLGGLLTEAITRGGQARMRIMRVFCGKAGFRLTVEPLTEAEPIFGSFGIEPLLELSAAELKRRLPKARARLSRGDQAPLAALGARISKRMEHLHKGDPEAADRLYHLDVLRLRLERFDAQIEALQAIERFREDRRPRPHWQTSGRSRDRSLDFRALMPDIPGRSSADLIACFAEAFFLERALKLVDAPDQHAIFVELLRVGKARQGARFLRGEAAKDLMEALTQAYQQGPEGELEAFAAKKGEALIEGEGALSLESGPGSVDHVVLKLVGLCLYELMRGETGAHIWQSITSGTELVRVRVWPAPPGERPRAVIERHLEARRIFEAAMEAGEAAPFNPDHLLPAVRVLTFRPQSGPGQGQIDVEDYGLGYSQTVNATSLLEALRPMWLLRKSLV